MGGLKEMLILLMWFGGGGHSGEWGEGLWSELYLLTPSDPQLSPSTPSKLSYSLQLSLEDFPGVQQAMLPCSSGYATLFSRLC